MCLQGGLLLPPPSTGSAPAESGAAHRPGTQNPPTVRPWIPPQPPADPKQSTRDPRLNRGGPLLKEQPAAKRESPHPPGGPRAPERPPRPDRPRTPRKEAAEEKLKSKSPSPLAKGLLGKSKQAEVETPKPNEVPKKDPRLKKRLVEKTAEVKEVKEEELKEKKRCVEKKEREEAPRRVEPPRSAKTKPLNGLTAKHDYLEAPDKAGADPNRRKRTRSRSPTTSPKRKDRRSPKSHARSGSLSPPHRPGKPRRPRGDEAPHGKPERLGPKKVQADGRRPKRPQEERRSESRDPHSPRGHEGGKEPKDLHRWRSGWEENKQ